MKPLGYYVASIDDNEQDYLEHLQDIYGCTFERMTKIQKLAVLSHISQTLLNVELHMQGQSVFDYELKTADNIIDGVSQNITIGLLPALADALVQQIKYQH